MRPIGIGHRTELIAVMGHGFCVGRPWRRFWHWRHCGCFCILLAGGFGWLGLSSVLGAANATAPATLASSSPVLELHPDGTILEPGGDLARAVGGAPRPIRWEFGLPASAPVYRGHADEIRSICVSRWEERGIRYTQTVLVTGLTSEAGSARVLMVQLTGENGSREYSEATAAFAVVIGDEILELEWRQGFVHARNLPQEPVIAAIEIGAEGIAESSGPRLKFRGQMPPGTSGAMTIKIPLDRLTGEAQLNHLHDLEFDQEYRRLKRSWSSQTAAPGQPGIELAGP